MSAMLRLRVLVIAVACFTMFLGACGEDKPVDTAEDVAVREDAPIPREDVPDPTAQCKVAADCAAVLDTLTQCQVAECNLGECEAVAKPAKSPCDDNNPATLEDQCTAEGLCAGKAPAVVCGDGNCSSTENKTDCPQDCAICMEDADCGACAVCTDGDCASAAECAKGDEKCEAGKHFTCDGCSWVLATTCECGCTGTVCATGECTPEETKTGETCGMCGTRHYTCSPTCTWELDGCIDQGECAPATVTPCGLCGGHKTCSASCVWQECRGEVTIGVAHAVYDGGPEEDHDIAAAQTLEEMLKQTFGPDCVHRMSVGSVEQATQFVQEHTATVFLAGQCSWGIGSSALNCNGNTFQCTNAGMTTNVWGDLLASACEVDVIACTDGWLVQKGSEQLACTQTSNNCVFSVMGWDAAGTYDASVQFASLLSAHAYAPCTTPGLTPDCNMICHWNKLQCGSVDECNCGDCGPCQACDAGKCITQEGLGTPCGNGGCNECVEGAVACVGEQCGLCTQACGVLKSTGCLMGADFICATAGITGLFEGDSCSAIVSMLCEVQVGSSTNCHDVCASQGWCPTTTCL